MTQKPKSTTKVFDPDKAYISINGKKIEGVYLDDSLPFKKCDVCLGEGWVCENHPENKWNEGDPKCCGGAGMPCVCNKVLPPWNFVAYD